MLLEVVVACTELELLVLGAADVMLLEDEVVDVDDSGSRLGGDDGIGVETGGSVGVGVGDGGGYHGTDARCSSQVKNLLSPCTSSIGVQVHIGGNV